MPVELGVWRIDGQLSRVPAVPLDLESRLEDILDREIAIANQNTVARPRDPKWAYTVERLQERFGFSDHVSPAPRS